MEIIKINNSEYLEVEVEQNSQDFRVVHYDNDGVMVLHYGIVEDKKRICKYIDVPYCNWHIVADTKTAKYSSSFEVKIVLEQFNLYHSKRYIVLKKIDNEN